MNDQQPSTSSSSCTTNPQRKIPTDTSEDGQVHKKLMEDSKPENENAGAVAVAVEDVDESKCFIAKLPTEMLMKILEYLNNTDVLVSRLVSRHWNETACNIIRSRSTLYIKFRFLESKTPAIRWVEGEKMLGDFVECALASKNFPFTRLDFRGTQRSMFDHADWIQFVSKLGKTVKSLKLWILHETNEDEGVSQLTKIFRELLLNQTKPKAGSQLPNLQEFGLLFDAPPSTVSAPSKLELFPKNLDSGSTASSTAPKTVSLPLLKVIHLDEFWFANYPQIVTDLLRAATKLQKILFINHQVACNNKTFEYFHHLQSLGKLECLQELSLEPTKEFFQAVKKMTATGATGIPSFKLKTLELGFFEIQEQETSEENEESMDVWAEASVFVSTIFQSNKDTLRELNTESLGFLENLQLPRFSQLTSLVIQEESDQIDDDRLAVLPPGIKMADTFPVLRSLVLGLPWSTAFPDYECISSIPTLTSLKILGANVSGMTISEISCMCPNLKTFKILHTGRKGIEHFPDVGSAIWIYMKQLESLKLSIDAHSPANAFPAIDSTFTGYSREDCERIYDLIKADKLLKKRESQLKIPQSELQAERINPSILDLTDLRHLEISLIGWYLHTDPRPTLIKKAITFVSEECAFKLMENLVYKTEKEVKSYDTEN